MPPAEPRELCLPPLLLLPAEIRVKIFDCVFNTRLITLQTNFVRLPRISNAAQIFRTCRLFNSEARPIFFSKLGFQVLFISDLKTHLGSSAASLIRNVVWDVSLSQVKYLQEEVHQRWERSGLRNVQYLCIRVNPNYLADGPDVDQARSSLHDIAREIVQHSKRLCRATEVDPSFKTLGLEYTLDDGTRDLKSYVRMSAIPSQRII